MKKNFSCIFFLPLLFCLSSCNNSDTGKTTQSENQATPEVKSVFINGDSIHYIDIGKGDPVVFVHGTVGDYRTWGAQMDTFSKNHRVIAYSRRFAFPNKQMINDTADYSTPVHAKDLAELIKALNLEPVHLVGTLLRGFHIIINYYRSSGAGSQSYTWRTPCYTDAGECTGRRYYPE